MKAVIKIGDTITVGDLADKLSIPVAKIITELMKNGVMATVNEKIDFDTAQIITEELGLEVELVKSEKNTEVINVKPATSNPDAVHRPPVVAVMGHVDHGKTSLLDAIKDSEVVKAEAGGITQHISAYYIKHKDRAITFLDTPGHEAFAALREHGAQLTDLVIIVVAADDGIKPQTLEAIRFARKAGVKIVVAMTKMDKQDINPDRVKQQLAENELLPEDWGGETVVMGVSAKTGQGVKELLDMVTLIGDVEELKALDNGPATGLIIESHMEQGRGAVARALVTEGRLKPGDIIVAGSAYGKIRNLESTDGRVIKEATPSMPVVISGLKSLPEFADSFVVVKTEKEARQKASSVSNDRLSDGGHVSISGSELIRLINRSNQLQELNVIVKADVQGSLTSVIDSLKTLNNDEVAVKVISSGVGPVNENDIRLASASDAIIYGFHIQLPSGVKQLASRDKVSIRLFQVIYELIDDTKIELSNMLAPEVIETDLGTLIVRGIFKTTKSEIICGGEVTKGKLQVPALARVVRNKEQIAEVEVTNLKRGPQDAKEILEGEMCGLSLVTKTRLDIEEGDRVELFTRELKQRSLR